MNLSRGGRVGNDGNVNLRAHALGGLWLRTNKNLPAVKRTRGAGLSWAPESDLGSKRTRPHVHGVETKLQRQLSHPWSPFFSSGWNKREPC